MFPTPRHPDGTKSASGDPTVGAQAHDRGAHTTPGYIAVIFKAVGSAGRLGVRQRSLPASPRLASPRGRPGPGPGAPRPPPGAAHPPRPAPAVPGPLPASLPLRGGGAGAGRAGGRLRPLLGNGEGRAAAPRPCRDAGAAMSSRPPPAFVPARGNQLMYQY